MNKLLTLPRLACLTTVLAAGPALMATADIANAKGSQRSGNSQQHSSHGHQGNGNQGNTAKRNGIRPRFVVSGQPANVKRVLHNRKEKGDQAHCKTNCDKPGNPSQPTQPTQASKVTISNGVTTSDISGNGVTVTSTTPGKITVTNSNGGTVTLPGGSLTVSGATSVKVGAGLETHTQPNGTVTIAIKPAGTQTPPTTAGNPSGNPPAWAKYVNPATALTAGTQVPGVVGAAGAVGTAVPVVAGAAGTVGTVGTVGAAVPVAAGAVGTVGAIGTVPVIAGAAAPIVVPAAAAVGAAKVIEDAASSVGKALDDLF